MSHAVSVGSLGQTTQARLPSSERNMLDGAQHAIGAWEQNGVKAVVQSTQGGGTDGLPS